MGFKTCIQGFKTCIPSPGCGVVARRAGGRAVLHTRQSLDDQVEAMKITNTNKAMGAGWRLIAYNDGQNTDNAYRRSLP
jgi:hypothetical protein